MSTKIYNGVKFDVKSYDELIEKLITDIKIPIVSMANIRLKGMKRDIQDLIYEDECYSNCGVCIIKFDSEYYGLTYFPLGFDISKIEFIKDFHYQNQSDIPENVSTTEWDHRGHIWDMIFKNEICAMSVENMISISFLPKEYPWWIR